MSGTEKLMRFFKRSTIALLLATYGITAMAASTTSENNQSSHTHPDPFKRVIYYRLPNGMQVYLLPDPKASKVQAEVDVGVGYDNENEKNYGLSHLVEHMVFRDRRIPHHDYLDYIKDQGGTGVNASTKRYETDYYATIAPPKAEWLIQSFAQMLLDKNLTQEDLNVEKKALQIEIGEPHLIYQIFYKIGRLIQTITPPSEDLYRDWFSLPKQKELPSPYIAQINNRRFTLGDVLRRYRTYYYPANMKLFVAGNFDPERMRQTIRESFGKTKRRGTLSVSEPHPQPRLPKKPYAAYNLGSPKSYASVATMFVMKDYRRYLILDAYTDMLAERLQQQLRNRAGKTYTVSATSFGRGYAQVMGISLDGPHRSFDANIHAAEAMISADRQKMPHPLIEKTLWRYEKENFTDIEHDTDTLMSMLGAMQYLREDFNITDKTPYDLFKSITPETFARTVSEAFAPRHRYLKVWRDYAFFPMELVAMSLLTLILFILTIVFYPSWLMRIKGIRFTQRDVRLSRRLSSRFTGTLIFIVTYLLAALAEGWVIYLVGKWIFHDPYWVERIDAPLGHLIWFLEFFLFLALYVGLYYLLWRYYAKLFVTDDRMIALGNRVLAIDKDQIAAIDVVPARERKWRRTLGAMLRFYKPVVKLTLKDGKIYYLRNSNAQELKEDLERWMQEQRGKREETTQ
ncbi:M16 family metallopeptidase [Nitratifractor salsuginis]|uniref:Peptidase M16 domain protein n=1 Tax=Nitratifractor salsuginis (strain DSM 16511 / JCM 12458 / E9I37-1) TaxID=749222 RepID=E6X0Z0_NITSE|nr:insulinase family protein [Nitratifractor salsuginis]ADV46922.1 peptidase M16 domain protein [Nitratifractor salsuginis DSM 16511]